MCVAWLSSPTKMAQVDPSRVVQIQLTKRTELKESHFVSVLKIFKRRPRHGCGKLFSQHTQRAQALLPGGLAIRVFLGLNHQQCPW